MGPSRVLERLILGWSRVIRPYIEERRMSLKRRASAFLLISASVFAGYLGAQGADAGNRSRSTLSSRSSFAKDCGYIVVIGKFLRVDEVSTNFPYNQISCVVNRRVMKRYLRRSRGKNKHLTIFHEYHCSKSRPDGQGWEYHCLASYRGYYEDIGAGRRF